MFFTLPLMKPRKISLTFVDSSATNLDLTTYTFSSLNLGTAAADRTIIVAVTSDQGAGGSSETVTVGGVSATLITRQNAGSGDGVFMIALYRVAVPTGTTADVVVTFPFTMGSCTVRLFRLVGALSPVPVYSNNLWNGLSTITFTQSVPANSVSLMVAALENTSATHSWSGTGFPSPSTSTGNAGITRSSHARDTYELAGTNYTFTVTASASPYTAHRAVIAIWN